MRRPTSRKTETHLAYPIRGPKRAHHRGPALEPVEWYWRIKTRRKSRVCWSGWATLDSVDKRLACLAEEAQEIEAKAKTSEAKAETSEAKAKTSEAKAKTRLKVAVVSHPAYVKTLIKALQDRGHLAFSFPNLSASIPPTMDAIICRPKAVKHQAYDICIAEQRAGRRPVIFENGVTKAMEAIDQVVRGTWQASESSAKSQEQSNDREQPSGTCMQHIETVINRGGLFGPVLLHRSASQARDALEAIPHSSFQVGRSAVYDALTALADYDVSEVLDCFLQKTASSTLPTFMLWWRDPQVEAEEWSKARFLARRPMTTEQKYALAAVLSHEARLYVVERPKAEEEVAVEVEEAEEEVAVEVEEAEEEMEGASGVPEAEFGAELASLLQMLAEHLRVREEAGHEPCVPHAALDKHGLIAGGSLRLAVRHLHTPAGTACSKPAKRLTKDPAQVTCQTCRATKAYDYAEWFLTA